MSYFEYFKVLLLCNVASRVLFDPTKCSQHPNQHRQQIIPPTPQPGSIERKLGKFLKLCRIEGKGFGVRATQDIESYTIIFTEAPFATALLHQGDRQKEQAGYESAVRKMSSKDNATFYGLHEGVRPFPSREMRIWTANAFAWKAASWRSVEPVTAIFRDMSRFNHSCVPNAAYQHNEESEKQELYSIRNIAASEEVTICYPNNFEMRTGSERKAWLKILDHIKAPDFSASALNIARPSSTDPVACRSWDQSGFSDGQQIFRPGTFGRMRRIAKLSYDEGLTDGDFIKQIFVTSATALSLMRMRMIKAETGRPVDPLPVVGRYTQLMLASSIVARSLKSPRSKDIIEIRSGELEMLKIWNSTVLEEMALSEAKTMIKSVIESELDPFEDNPMYRV